MTNTQQPVNMAYSCRHICKIRKTCVIFTKFGHKHVMLSAFPRSRFFTAGRRNHEAKSIRHGRFFPIFGNDKNISRRGLSPPSRGATSPPRGYAVRACPENSIAEQRRWVRKAKRRGGPGKSGRANIIEGTASRHVTSRETDTSLPLQLQYVNLIKGSTNRLKWPQMSL